MGLFGSKTPPRAEGERPAQPHETQRPAAAPVPAGQKPPAEVKTAVIGPNIRIQGELSGDEDLVVEGRVEGKISVTKGLRIGPQAQVNAEVKAHHVVIAGRVVGNVVAAEKVEILPSGILEGNIRAPKIAIAEGAQFKGSVDMGGKAPVEPAARAERAERPRQEGPEGPQQGLTAVAAVRKRPARPQKEQTIGMARTPTHKNYIGGKWIPSATGKTFENRNPANTDELLGRYQDSDERDAAAAVDAAAEAFKTWRLVPGPQRGEMLFRLGEIISRRKEEFSRDMVREMGKVLKEARGDVQEAIDMAYLMGGEGRRLHGATTPSELPDKFAMAVRSPIGVCAFITPWNFPMAIPAWKATAALICGNTIVIKPATDTPPVGHQLRRGDRGGRLPARRLQRRHRLRPQGRDAARQAPARPRRLVHRLDGRRPDDQRGVRPGLQARPPRDGGEERHHRHERRQPRARRRRRHLGRLRHERPALHGLLAGPRPEEDLQQVRRAVRRARRGAEGGRRPRRPASTWGPRSTRTSMKTVLEYIEIGKAEGATLAAGGRRLTGKAHAKGWFVAPTVFTDCHPKMRISQEEIFGPVTSVIPIRSLDEAIEVANDSEYGLSSAIFTQDVNTAFKAMRDLESGLFYVNLPTIGAEAHLPFGGNKKTGNGHREAGLAGLDVFSEWKSSTSTSPGRSRRPRSTSPRARATSSTGSTRGRPRGGAAKAHHRKPRAPVALKGTGAFSFARCFLPPGPPPVDAALIGPAITPPRLCPPPHPPPPPPPPPVPLPPSARARSYWRLAISGMCPATIRPRRRRGHDG